MRRVATGIGAWVGLTLAIGAAARAEDLSASVFTSSGYEIKRDDRLLALFSAFNVAGLERGETGRGEPFPRRLWHPVRSKVLGGIGAATAEKLRPSVEAFVAAHPLPMQAWLEATLSLGEADFASPTTLPTAFVGLDAWLAEFAKTAKLAKVGASVSEEYRASLKALLGKVDAPFARLRASFRLSEETAPALVLLPTPLDASGNAWALRTADGFHAVVFGLPAGEAFDLQPVLEAYARLLAAEGSADVGSKAVEEALAQLQSKGLLPATTTSAELVARSWAAAAVAGGPDDVDAAMRRGLVLARTFAKALAEPAAAFPAAKGTFAAQVMAKFDGKKALAEAVSGRK